jgi:hypothetical protein
MACATLSGLGFCGMSGDTSTCLDTLAGLRNDADNAGCRSQYDAWVACLGALASCPDGSGVLCPTEYSAFGMCVSPPP